MHHLLDEILNGPARYSIRHHFSPLWTLAFVLGILLAEFVAVYLIGYLIVKAVQDMPRSLVGYCDVLGLVKQTIFKPSWS